MGLIPEVPNMAIRGKRLKRNKINNKNFFNILEIHYIAQ